jgi:hypothetical protein
VTSRNERKKHYIITFVSRRKPTDQWYTSDCRPYLYNYGLHRTMRREQTLQSSDSCFIFQRPQIQILAHTLAILTEVFVFYLSPCRQTPVWYPKLGHAHFLPHPFLFIIHWSSYHLTLYTIDTVIKYSKLPIIHVWIICTQLLSFFVSFFSFPP